MQLFNIPEIGLSDDLLNCIMALTDGEGFNSSDKHGQTPLFIALKEGHEALVRLLLERQDVEVNSKDKNG